MNTLLLLMSCVPGEGVSSKVAEALAIAVAPMPLESTIYDDYDAAYNEALRKGQPLIVWVGQRPRGRTYCVVCYQPTFPDCPAKCVVVSKPGDGTMYWIATLDGVPTNAQMDDVLKRMPEGKTFTPKAGEDRPQAVNGQSETGPTYPKQAVALQRVPTAPVLVLSARRSSSC